MSILEKLGFRQRKHVGISISANNFIELVCIDKVTKAVVKYSSDNIKYNNSIREIVDYDELAESIERLFEDTGLDPRECCVTLSLPNVHFGITALDGASEENYVKENIASDLEDLYIFKRNEAATSYTTLENGITRGQKNIVYCAIQAKVIAKIIEIFDRLSAEIVRIDTSYSSLFKAIQFCERFNKYLLPDEKTTIVLITPNSCCSFFFVGPVISDVIEEPIAVKSFSSEEVYNVVSKMATNSILKNSPKSLLIISETDEVDSSTLAQRLDFAGEVDCINKSVNNSEQFIDVYGLGTDIDANMISYMTIESVGAAVADYDEYPLAINFVPQDRILNNIVLIGNYEVPFYNYLLTVFGITIALIILLYLIINFSCNFLIERAQESSSKTKKEINVFNRTVEDNKTTSSIDILPTMTKIVNQNKAIIEAYTALSTDIPGNIYIQKFVTQSNGAIGILGEAKTSESVQIFVDNLKEKNNKLMLTKLSINSQMDSVNSKIPDGFTFEIKTPTGNIDFDQNNSQTINNTNNKSGGFGFTNRNVPPPSPII